MASLMRQGDKILGYVVVDNETSNVINEINKLTRLLSDINSFNLSLYDISSGKKELRHQSLNMVQVFLSKAMSLINDDITGLSKLYGVDSGLSYTLATIENDIKKYNNGQQMSLDNIKKNVKNAEERLK